MGCLTFRIDDKGNDAVLHSIPTDKVLKVTEAIRVDGQVFFKTADNRFYSTVVLPTQSTHYSCGGHFHRAAPTLKALGKLGFLDTKVVTKWLRERDLQIKKDEAKWEVTRMKEKAALAGFKLVPLKTPAKKNEK